MATGTTHKNKNSSNHKGSNYKSSSYSDGSRNGYGSSGKSSSSKKAAAKRRKAKKRRRIILFTVEILALVILLAAIVGVNTINKMEKIDIKEGDIIINEQVQENEKVMEEKGLNYRNIALFGVDSRKGKLGKGQRSDTMIIASINEDTGDVKLLSLYRDTYLNLGNDKYNKANSAYGQGGPEQALNMINWNLDMNIKEYITIGFDGLIEVVDALGGIDIDVQENEINHLNNYQMSMFCEDENDPLNLDIVKVTQPGMQTLNGLQATAYCRIRYVGDDYGRTERQRKVIMACMDKAKQTSPATLAEILTKVLEHVSTNLDVTEMVSILGKLGNYQIVGQDGMPFASNRATGTIGKKGDCIVPLDLTENVRLMHEYLFGVSDYEPSDQVKEYAAQIASDTAQYIKK